MTIEAARAYSASTTRAETRPFIHPHSHEARGRALLHAEIARNCLIAAKHHRLEGRPSWSRSALASAGVSRSLARAEFFTARRGG